MTERLLRGYVFAGALLVSVILVVARALVPGLRGSVVGISAFIDAADTLSDVFTQLCAISTLGLLILLTALFARTQAALFKKLLVILLAGLLLLTAGGAMTIHRPPDFVLLVISGSALALSLVATAEAISLRRLGLLAWVPLTAIVGSLLRIGGIVAAEQAESAAVDVASIASGAENAVLLATLSLGTILAGSAVAGYWIAKRHGRRGALVVGGAVLAAVLAALARSRVPDVDDSTVVVVLRRGLSHLTPRPFPLFPGWFSDFGTALLVSLPLGLLALRVWLGRNAAALTPVILAGVALTLLARDGADVPLLALSLSVGALALAVASHHFPSPVALPAGLAGAQPQDASDTGEDGPASGAKPLAPIG